MKKEIKDYLHLYLGCQFVLKIKDSKQLTGQMYFGVDALSAAYSVKDKIEPILLLRPLSSMTEEEDKERKKISNSSISENNYSSDAEEIRFLLSKHFDLFGLIEEGLAIDATKHNSEQTVQESDTSKDDSSNTVK